MSLPLEKSRFVLQHCLYSDATWSSVMVSQISDRLIHDDVIEWKYFPRYWPFVRGIHRSPVNSPHKGQWRGALVFSLICVWINGWVNNHEAGDLRRYRAQWSCSTACPGWDQRKHRNSIIRDAIICTIEIVFYSIVMTATQPERQDVSNTQPLDCCSAVCPCL